MFATLRHSLHRLPSNLAEDLLGAGALIVILLGSLHLPAIL